jgi:hypothetical protein
VREPKASQKPWKEKRAATIWFALFCAYGSATTTVQYNGMKALNSSRVFFPRELVLD